MKNIKAQLLKLHYKNSAHLLSCLKELRQKKAKPDKIHEMRISVKKLKSLMYFLNYAAQSKSLKKLPEQLIQLFSTSGKCRDIRNLLSTGSPTIPIQQTLENELLKQQNVCQKKLDKLLKKSFKKSIAILDREIERIIKKFSNKDLNKKLFAFLHFLEEKVTLYSNISNIDPQELHYLRKILKRMIYQQEFIREIFEEQKHTNFGAQLESTEQLIGSWHDAKKALCQIVKINWRKNQENQEILSILKEKEKSLHTEVKHALKKTFTLLENEKVLVLV